jgi:SsrA-binding protein
MRGRAAVRKGSDVAKPDADGIRMIADNRKARHDYEILDRYEAGIVLLGSEVKSLRAGKVQVAGAHVRVIGGEAFLLGMHIAEYAFSHQFNHEPERQRKLLLHAREIDKIGIKLREQGLAAPLLRVYFRGRHIKVEFGIGRGRKGHDKRHALKERDAKREVARHHRG